MAGVWQSRCQPFSHDAGPLAVVPHAPRWRAYGVGVTELADLEREVAELDSALEPIANRPVDVDDPGWLEHLQARLPAVERAGVARASADVLDRLIELYASGDEPRRVKVRDLLRRHPSFRWGVGLPRDWSTPAELRRRLLLLSARDQGADPRDELMTLWSLCRHARELGIDVRPVLDEVIALSSEIDLYGMGSMQQLLASGLEEH
jgi:hypothetical protein